MRLALIFSLAGMALISPAKATDSWCAVPEKTPDGFISLRSGPGTQHAIVGRVVPSDSLLIDTGRCREAFGRQHCDESGKWGFVEVVYNLGKEQTTQSGWINTHHVRQIACADH